MATAPPDTGWPLTGGHEGAVRGHLPGLAAELPVDRPGTGSKHGGKASGKSGNSKQGGTTAQKKAAGRMGGKATAKKR
jgi:hypothetical protein